MHNIHAANISSIDPCRKAAQELGYDPSRKEDKDRQLLIALKQAWLVWEPEGPTQYILRSILGLPQPALAFVHIREIDQIALLKSHASVVLPDVRFETVHVLRPDYPIPRTSIDRGTLGRESPYPYDIFISNDGDLQELKRKAREYVEKVVSYYGLEGSVHHDRSRRR